MSGDIKMCNWFVLFSFLIVISVKHSYQVSIKEFLSLTLEQKHLLDLFRDRVIDKVPHDYMKKDGYLIFWLRDRYFDVPAAEQQLLKHLKWRADNKMDEILDEDWSDFDYQYRANVEGCDKEGKPVISIPVGDWDIRNAIVAGKTARLMRYIDKLLEEAVTMVRRMQDEDGKNVAQFVIIFDLSGFSFVQQGCPRCIPIYIYMLSSIEQHYPGFAHQLFAVNGPQYGVPLWNAYKSLLSRQTRAIVSVYGPNKNEWQNILLKEIDKDQLSIIYGGTQVEAMDIQDLRLTGEFYKCTNIDRILQVL